MWLVFWMTRVGPIVIMRVFISERVWWEGPKEAVGAGFELYIPAFEMEEGAEGEEGGQPPDAGKGKQMDSLLQSPERN